jgi:hypothetical protein
VSPGVRRSAAGLCVIAAASSALATKAAAATEVPVEIGIGPAAYFVTGPVQNDTLVHYGLRLNVEAVLDRAFIADHIREVPAQYQDMARRMNEVRVSPSLLIPDALIVSPKPLTLNQRTGMYGATWRPVSLGVPFGERRAHLGFRAGLVLTAFYLHSEVLPSTFFLRPGVELSASVVLELAYKKVYLSFGWASGLYVPQVLGTFVGTRPLDQAIWHLGQAFLQLHFRFNQRINL